VHVQTLIKSAFDPSISPTKRTLMSRIIVHLKKMKA